MDSKGVEIMMNGILEFYKKNKDAIDIFLRVLMLVMLVGIAWYVGRISAFLGFKACQAYQYRIPLYKGILTT